ncbi:MED14-domain-containing protein [Neolentinus lepideus HHB14362 ss-1]|uniref:Mediator of RNA polymerase II transcription subunit 14 n=1 Tax=Neolentinus lepideus HHB14362 ss-1 TaxID=1314782 RepID=A0A165RU10_9AGAM|nr:MED14-domain-containing protein [Neolentinus lepideus HHB14362 ss-1]
MATTATTNGTNGVNCHKTPNAIAGPGPSTINGFHEPSQEELERELPVVYDGQVPLGELLSRVAQAIYAELQELAETLPNMSDTARKRTLADWVVKTKKQVVKLYAVVKWSRDADTVQKAMNITAFLMNQNQQFLDTTGSLTQAKDNLDPARLRNHDLLTSLDVLTTGSYRRLPSAINKIIIPPTPLTDDQVNEILADVEDRIRYRLRMSEIIPIEISRYVIERGRVRFTAPKLFETSLCLSGAKKEDGWFFVDVDFLFKVGGDKTGMQEFPRVPTGVMKRHIEEGVNAQLGMYVPLPPPAEGQVPPVRQPPRPQLPEGVVDAPLVRVFNFLQMMSMSYMLEILSYQARRMCTLGWGEYLNVAMTPDHKLLTISYWLRKSLPKPLPPPFKPVPLIGGRLTISIARTRAPAKLGGGPARSAKDRILAELQQRAKLNAARPSDEVESMHFQVKWEPTNDGVKRNFEKCALGVPVAPEDIAVAEGELAVDANDLDLEALLRKALYKHAKGILKTFHRQLRLQPVFAPPGEVVLVESDDNIALRIHLCASEVVLVAIDLRTGKLIMRDANDLTAAGRSTRVAHLMPRLREVPYHLVDVIPQLRIMTITDHVEQKANYLGLPTYRHRPFKSDQLSKFGNSVRDGLYVQLAKFQSHYLVIVIMDDEIRYALISVKIHTEIYPTMIMEDIGWLDVRRIHGDHLVVSQDDRMDPTRGLKRKRSMPDAAADVLQGRKINSINLETQVLRELYSYCCARVAYMKVEQQLKLRGILYTHVNPSEGSPVTPELMHLQSSLARSVPGLCVQSADILSGAPAAEAAMPNIRVIPLNWWSEKKAQVVTCVKLKYVQQPMGKRAGSSAVIRPSKRIIYDTEEAVVSFLSEDVDKCVDEFLEEWARVSKMVVIAREVGQMSKEKKWPDIRLLSFDLQTVEFAYAADYTVSITCTDQLSPSGGTYELRFSRAKYSGLEERFNPHEDSEPFLRSLLRQGRLASSLQMLVSLLRQTLPIVIELDEILKEASEKGHPLDTFPKAVGWYRLLYGDFRHALDFRLMKGRQIAVLDASHSVYGGDSLTSSFSLQNDPGSPSKRQAVGVSSLTGKAVQRNDTGHELMVLQAIPGFKEIVQTAVKEVGLATKSRGRFAAVDVGIICDISLVRPIIRSVHEKVLQRLQILGET